MRNKKIINYALFTLFALFVFRTQVYADCILGPNVTKDVTGALKILRYIAPALVVGFTIYEAVGALGKGNMAEEGKRLWKRLLKRLIYVVLLFFVPTLILIAGDLSGILSEKDCLTEIQSGNVSGGGGSKQSTDGDRVGENPDDGVLVITGQAGGNG